MAFIPVPLAAIAHINYEWFGQQVQNTLWFRNDSAVNSANVASLAGALEDYIHLNWLPIQSNQLSFRNVEVVGQTSQPDFTFTSDQHAGELGGVGAISVANSITIAVSFRSGLTGRSNRGRNYWLGIPESQVINNVVDPSYQEQITQAYEGMVGLDAISGGWQWCIASRYTGGDPRPVGVTRAVEAVVIVDSIVDNQRRRLPGRGV